MTEKDDELIQRFLLPGKREVENNGFSERVKQRLPRRTGQRLSLSDVICALLCCVLFFALDGFSILLNTVTKLIATLSNQIAIPEINYQALAIAAIVFVVIGVQRACDFKE